MNYLLKRIGIAIPTLLFVSTAVFFLIHLLPGDPVDFILGADALVEDRQYFREALRLHLPLHEQFLAYFAGLFQGDLGTSLFDRRPVMTLLLERFPATLELAAGSLLVAFSLALLFGLTAALRKDTAWDRGTLFVSLLGISIPHFWLGPLLMLLFSIQLGLLPISGRTGFASLILPSITLGSGLAAILTRMMRSSMIETLREDYIRTARAKGLSEKEVVGRHALRNALNPVVTLLGLQLGVLLGGTIVTEKIFAWPGVGSLLIGAIERRDYPVVQGCILMITVSYVLVNLLTDLIYAKLDPRIRYEK